MSREVAVEAEDLEIEVDDDVAEPSTTRLGPGAVVAQRYHIEALVGRGGAATVWRARDQVLDRAVALKTLSPHAMREGHATHDRFLREARICAAIQHPNVVSLLDVGTHHGRPFLVMELLEGEPLDAKLDREVQLEVREAIAIATGILDGLSAAHEAGIVHRDLKPGNVFLVRDGLDVLRPKLLDFGVSRSLDLTTRRSAYTTAEGQLLGTPEYMSPEQARGARSLDLRTDLYSAGVILYEMLAGILPYEAEALGDLIVEIVTGDPAPLSRIRPDVGPISDVLVRAMARQPAHRYASAREMRDALREAAEKLRRDQTAPTLVERPSWEEPTIVRPIAPRLGSGTGSIPSITRVRGSSGPPRGGEGRASIAIGIVCIVVGLALALSFLMNRADELEPDAIIPGPHVVDVVTHTPSPSEEAAHVESVPDDEPPVAERTKRPSSTHRARRARPREGHIFRQLDY